MAGFAGSGGDDELITGVNITPLVDVVLVLLIIFMIAAPVIYQSAVKVQLPKARSGEPQQQSPLNFTITKDGALSLDKELLEWSSLTKRLTAFGEKITEQTAIISADQATPHGSVIQLMDALRQSGLTRFALNVESTK